MIGFYLWEGGENLFFREMRYVYEVYRQSSFSKAAQALMIAQPSLSQMVKKAEERIGGPIFDRSTSPISLTELGRAYIQAAEEMMRIEEGFGQYLSDAEQCLRGVLTLGGTTLFTSYVLPPLISAFSSQYPGVEIRLHEQHTTELKQELQDGVLDLAVDNSLLDPSRYDSHLYQQEQILLAVPRELAPAGGSSAVEIQRKGLNCLSAVSLSSFAHLPFLLLKEGNDTRTRAETLCAQAGFTPRVQLQLDQQLAAYNLAAYGLGAAFISDTLVKCAPPDERLVFFRLDSPDVHRSIFFFHKKNRFVTAPMAAFLKLLQTLPHT